MRENVSTEVGRVQKKTLFALKSSINKIEVYTRAFWIRLPGGGDNPTSLQYKIYIYSYGINRCNKKLYISNYWHDVHTVGLYVTIEFNSKHWFHHFEQLIDE